MASKKELDAKKTGFSPVIVKAFKGDFVKFKAWFDPKYKNLTAEDVWKSIGGDIKK